MNSEGLRGSPFLSETKSRNVNNACENAKKDVNVSQPDYPPVRVTAIIRRSDESTEEREFRESYETTNSKS